MRLSGVYDVNFLSTSLLKFSDRESLNDSSLNRLRSAAAKLIDQSSSPYSASPVACAAMLSDGQWIPGVRVESASFSLVIPAIVNVLSTAVALRRYDVVAIALSRPAKDFEINYLASSFPGPFSNVEKDLFVRGKNRTLPEPSTMMSPYLPDSKSVTAIDGIALAREIAEHASVGESDFPVGCILDCGEHGLIPGVNVEHPDWTRIICAERNAVGTAVSYGVYDYKALYLSCRNDKDASPCGACRQVLVELAPDATVWMDRGDFEPASSTPSSLLPGSFTGSKIRRQPSRR